MRVTVTPSVLVVVLLTLRCGLSETLVVRLELTKAVSLWLTDGPDVSVGRSAKVRVSVIFTEPVADESGVTLDERVVVTELDSDGVCAAVFDGDALFSVFDSVVDLVVLFEIERDFCWDGVAEMVWCVMGEVGDSLLLSDGLLEPTSDRLRLVEAEASNVKLSFVDDTGLLKVRRSVADAVPEAAN